MRFGLVSNVLSDPIATFPSHLEGSSLAACLAYIDMERLFVSAGFMGHVC